MQMDALLELFTGLNRDEESLTTSGMGLHLDLNVKNLQFQILKLLSSQDIKHL